MNCAIVCTAVRVPFGQWHLSVFLAGGWPWRSLSIRDDKDATEHTPCCPHSRLRPFFVATANFDSRAHWLRFTTESPQPWKSSYCGPGLFSLGQLTFECCVIRTRQKLRYIFFECVKLLSKNLKILYTQSRISRPPSMPNFSNMELRESQNDSLPIPLTARWLLIRTVKLRKSLVCLLEGSM